MKKDLCSYLGLLLRGMAMGAADVVPGVSGGTVAFITGIYSELINSLRNCDHRALRCLYNEGVVSAWHYINGSFLLAVFGGILISVFSLAKAVTFALQAEPILVWSLFFGLILASSWHLLQQVGQWRLSRFCLLLIGILLAIAVAQIKPASLPQLWWVFLLAGMVAISAMILPGISGGFLLLVMGLYSTVVESIAQFDMSVLVPFALGCLFGLLLFSHFLGWLLSRFEAETMAFLTGVLVGSLNIIWPWKQTLESVMDRHGEWVPVVQANVSPLLYSKITGNSSQLYPAITLCLVGVILVLLIEFVAKRSRAKT